jgi:lipopolysaccharide biosynthesis glycosyltransferase
MVIVYCSDEKFVQHLLIAIHSLRHHNKNEELVIYILDGGISIDSKKLLSDFSKTEGFELNFIEVDFSLYDGFLVNGHISRATYYRISIPELLPLSCNKVLYLDCDTIVNKNIRELWNRDLEGNAVAAVPEVDNYRNVEMGLGNTKTFNAGVLLLDLSKWRKEGLSKKVLNFIKENPHKIKYHDQDALNFILLNDWLELPIRWNLTSPFISRNHEILDEEMKRQINEPAIIHFSASFKPWHYQLRHPYKYLYTEYLKKSPFRNYRPPDKTIVNVIRKNAALFLIALNLK